MAGGLVMGDPFTGGFHEEWDAEIPYGKLCPACKGYPQGHTRDENCRFPPQLPGVGGIVIQDIRIQTSDPNCQED